jgi:hypothetical protein
MTKQQHPVTPSWEQIDKWKTNRKCGESFERLLIMAAQWGADQELEACCTEVSFYVSKSMADKFRAARRPKLQSLKQQALEAFERFTNGDNGIADDMRDGGIIRRALEALPND